MLKSRYESRLPIIWRRVINILEFNLVECEFDSFVQSIEHLNYSWKNGNPVFNDFFSYW